MNEYKIRRQEFDWMGNRINGWLVLDTFTGETVVAAILAGDNGQVFKEHLIRAGAIEECDGAAEPS